MPRVIDLASESDPPGCSLGACIAALDASGFDPRDEGSVLHAAHWLSRLGHNRDFLAERLLAPALLRRVYRQELALLDGYARHIDGLRAAAIAGA